MNCSAYIFGELTDGYSQYPEDSSSNLFQNIYKMCGAPTQMIIHREGSLMYYIYVRKIDAKRYIGLAIIINGQYITKPISLFAIFERTIEELAQKGIVIHFKNNGDLTCNTVSLSEEEEEIAAVINSLQHKIEVNGNLTELPPVDYRFSINSQKVFNESDNDREIADCSYKFAYTIVLKEEDYDTLRITSFRSILRNLTAEKNRLIKANEDLRETNRKILRKKKQFKNVIVLFLVVIGCGIGLLVLNDNLTSTQSQLDHANNTIKEKESVIADKDIRIMNLRDTVRVLRSDLQIESTRRERAEEELDRVTSNTPFVVLSNEVNASQFKFSYYSMEERNITVILKAVAESGVEIVSNTHNITIFPGVGTKELAFAHRLDTYKYYYVVLIYDGMVISGRRW